MRSRPSSRTVPERLAAGLVAAVLLACEESAPPAIRQNILLITVDTLRADHLGCYGYFRDTSPGIDALAKEAIVFDRCIATIATTLPSHLSLFSSTYPIEHGVLSNVRHGGEQAVPAAGLLSFAGYARSIGYSTAAFVSASPVKSSTGLAAGFSFFDEPDKARRSALVTTHAALAWLEQTEEPFFAWIHYFDPHSPYEPQEPYDQAFSADEELEAYLTARDFSDSASRVGGQPVEARSAINAYDGEILYTDAQIQRLFKSLRERKLWDRTVVVFTADHGEGLCQHDEPGHGVVWEEQVHVPWILRAPGHPARRIPKIVSHLDIFPTVIGLLDLPDAQRFLEQARGADALAESYAERGAFSQTSDRHLLEGSSEQYALTTERWKLIHTDGKPPKLFALSEDPHELENCAEEHPQVVEELQRELLERVERQRANAALRGVEPGRTLSDDEMRELKELGYLDD